MNFNDIAISSIKSNYIRNYLTHINHEFTLEEQLAILYNSDIDIDTKENIYREYKLSRDLSNYKYNNLRKIDELLDNLIYSIDLVKEYLKGTNETILVFNEPLWNEIRCAKSLNVIEKTVKHNNIPETIEVTVYDIYTTKLLCYITLNNKFKCIKYDIIHDDELNKLQNYYVNIPNDINAGDIVKIAGNIEGTKEYIVVSNSKIPDELSNECSYSDASLTIADKNIFSKDKTYKEQIDSIILNRINNINNEEDTEDILDKQHKNIHITLIEKI